MCGMPACIYKEIAQNLRKVVIWRAGLRGGRVHGGSQAVHLLPMDRHLAPASIGMLGARVPRGNLSTMRRVF